MEERSPTRVRNELVVSIVDALQDSDTVNQASTRELWREMLADELGSPVDSFGGDRLRPWLLHLVKMLTDVGDGLACLVRTLEYVEPHSATVAALGPLVDEWAAVEFFSHADLNDLRPVLLSLPSSDLAAMARRASRSRVQELPPWCRTAWQVFLRLAGEQLPAGELPPSMAFLALCADLLVEEGRADAAERLRRFNRRQAFDLGVADLLADWQHSQFLQPAPSLVPAYLIIQFQPDGIEADQYYVSHWRQSDSEGWHPVRGETVRVRRDDLPTTVERLVEETEDRWADLRQPVAIEFVLPWELINEPVEWWSKESGSLSPTPLALDYPVVVRSLERLQRAAWHRPWHNKWRQLRERPADSHSHRSRPDQDGAYIFNLERELRDDSHAVCLVLSKPPGDDSGTGLRELQAGLRAGVPAIIWHRTDSSDPAFQDALAEILEDRGLGGLAARVGKWRKEALALGPGGWDQHVGRHLAILLDDPERKPGPPREVLGLARTSAQPVGLSRPVRDASGAARLYAPAADAGDTCRVRVTLLDESPADSAEKRLLLRVAPGPHHPWSESDTARRPWLTVTATPLTPAVVEPATALVRPSEEKTEGAEFTVVAHHPGRHFIRFTVSLARTDTVLQQVETEFDVVDSDCPPGSAAAHPGWQQGGSGR
ncbi:VMAP-C domain-containing protein [Streptomyces sp. NPDC054766]